MSYLGIFHETDAMRKKAIKEFNESNEAWANLRQVSRDLEGLSVDEKRLVYALYLRARTANWVRKCTVPNAAVVKTGLKHKGIVCTYLKHGSYTVYLVDLTDPAFNWAKRCDARGGFEGVAAVVCDNSKYRSATWKQGGSLSVIGLTSIRFSGLKFGRYPFLCNRQANVLKLIAFLKRS
jgi:hypothetical protein